MITQRPSLKVLLLLTLLLLLIASPQLGRAQSPLTGQIAYVTTVSAKSQVFVMTASGKASRQLTRAGNNTSPAWSPDGRKIAFTSDRDGSRQIYVMGANTEALTRLTQGNKDYDQAAW